MSIPHHHHHQPESSGDRALDTLSAGSTRASDAASRSPGATPALAARRRLQFAVHEIWAANDAEQAVRLLVEATFEAWRPDLACILWTPGEGTSELCLLYQRTAPACCVRGMASEMPPGLPSDWPLRCWQDILKTALQQQDASLASAFDRLVMLPLSAERLWGIVALIPSVLWPLTPQDIEFLALTAEHAARAIEQIALHQSHARLQEDYRRAIRDLTHMHERLLLAEVLATVGQLASGVMHELNNPLTSIIGYAEMVAASDVPVAVRSDLEIIRNEAQRCQHIVRNLLSFVRQREDGLSTVAINDLVQRTLELKAYALRSDGIRVVLDLEPDLPPVRADPCKLQQVLLNLVNNAHDAMAESCGRKTLTITGRLAHDRRHGVRLAVTDTGPGISPEIRERLFEPFLSTKHSKSGSGTGLGLNISKHLVSELGGELVLDTSYTQGARFIIELPIAETSDANQIPGQGQGASPAAPNIRGARVLVVDDEADLLTLFRRLLTKLGCRVTTAAGGAEALQCLAEQTYDSIVLDVKMPGMSGQQVYQMLQSTYPELSRRVIFVTGDTVDHHTGEWLQATQRVVLEKPFGLDELSRAIRTMLAANAAQRHGTGPIADD